MQTHLIQGGWNWKMELLTVMISTLKRHYEEGYDVYNEGYTRWLMENHSK